MRQLSLETGRGETRRAYLHRLRLEALEAVRSMQRRWRVARAVENYLRTPPKGGGNT